MNIATMRIAILVAALGLGGTSVCALTADQVNDARFIDRHREPQAGPDRLIVKAYVLLSRRSISPSVIDGGDGENFRKAVAQFRRQERLGEGMRSTT